MGDPKLSDSARAVNVILLHGFGDTCRIFLRMRAYLEERGRRVHCLNLAPNWGGSGIEDLAQQVAEYVAHRLAGEPFDVVGFSMGGLVARYFVQRLAEGAQARRLVTISSPHRGTLMGYLWPSQGARQMRPGSDFLRELNSGAQFPFTSIWTPYDLMIVPCTSSIVIQATMIRIPGKWHARMVKDGRVLAAVEKSLS